MLLSLPNAQPGIVSLLVDGWVYEGWTEVEVKRSLKTAAGEFSLHVTEGASGGLSGILGWGIREGSLCQIFYGGILVMTGSVDGINPRFSRRAHDLTIIGRSRTADLVDSSVDKEIPKGELKKVTLDQAARKAISRFGIPLVVQAQITERFSRMTVYPGETVHRFLERYARPSGVAVTDTKEGALRFYQAQGGAAVTSLEEGVNILEGSAMLRADTRHSEYSVIGQERGSDQEYGEPVHAVEAQSKDKAVKRYRPHTLLNESKTSKSNARARAAWEKSARAGESARADIRVVDWIYAPGAIWEPGLDVQVTSPSLRLDRVLTVENVSLSQSRSQGTLAQLQLVPPEAITPKESGGPGSGAATGRTGNAVGAPRASLGPDGVVMWTNVK